MGMTTSQREDYVQMLEELTDAEGDSVTVLCENPEPETVEARFAVEVCGDWTNWRAIRYFGPSRYDALFNAYSAFRGGRERAASALGY